VSLARDYGLKQHLATLLNNLAAAHHSLGVFDDALVIANEGLSVARATGAKSSEMFALGLLGHISFQQSRKEEARDRWTASLSLAQKLGERAEEVAMTLHLHTLVDDDVSATAPDRTAHRVAGHVSPVSARSQVHS
jgi:tetratricopeptide (TPR) repeat protein